MNRRKFATNCMAVAAAPLIPHLLGQAAVEPASSTAPAPGRSFISRLQPTVAGGGFELPDHQVWCGAPIRAEDGRYHLFASRVPKDIPFHPHWLFCSEIVRADRGCGHRRR